MHRFSSSIAIASSVAIVGCQRYQPKPLDVETHQGQWQERNLAHQDIIEFAQRLAASQPHAPVYDPVDGLTLDEAELVALVFNPDLRLERSRTSVAAASAEFAGDWEDPVFALDLLRIVESVPEPWILGTSLGFTIPLSGRLDAAESQAQAEHSAAMYRAAAREWQTVSELRAAWVEWSSANMQAEVLSELVERLNQIASVVNRLEQAGELPRIEARLFGIEAATRASEVRELAATAIDLELQIKAILGLRPESQLNLVPLVSINLPESADEHTLAEANATLLARRAEYEVAERNFELEIRKQYPDLSIGPAYENEEDQSRIGFRGAFPIPLWNRNRKGIAEAEAERESARIAFETEYETVVSQHARAGREYELRKQMREELESTLIPLVEDQLRDAQRMIELGEMNSLVQLESVVGRAEAKLKLIEARQRESQSANRVRALLGPPKPIRVEGQMEVER